MLEMKLPVDIPDQRQVDADDIDTGRRDFLLGEIVPGIEADTHFPYGKAMLTLTRDHHVLEPDCRVDAPQGGMQ